MRQFRSTIQRSKRRTVRFLCAVAALFALFAQTALAEDPRPAGYIMAYDLKGADAEKGTAIVRNGAELAPKLLMPLYNDDSVFIRDEASTITLSLAREGNLVVSGKLRRKDISGEMDSGDGGFDIIGQVLGILTGHAEEDSLSVLVAKGGGELTSPPQAVRGRNYVVRGDEPVRVVWTGGEGPFSVLVDRGQGSEPISQTAREAEVRLADIGANRFTVVVTDARKRKLRIGFEMKDAPPAVPEDVKARDVNGVLSAAWLAGQKDGAWRFEALRQLRKVPPDETTKGLIAALEKGWLPK